MEDVFELLRQRTTACRSRPSTPCSRAWTPCRRRSSRSRPTAGGARPAPLVTRLRSLVRPARRTGDGSRRDADPLDHAAVIAAQEAGARVLRVRGDAGRGSADAGGARHMVLAALGDHGEVLASAPAPDAVEQFQGRRDRRWIASEHADEAIAANVASVSEVVHVEVNEVPNPGAGRAADRGLPHRRRCAGTESRRPVPDPVGPHRGARPHRDRSRGPQAAATRLRPAPCAWTPSASMR